jgi:hypothetical protein
MSTATHRTQACERGSGQQLDPHDLHRWDAASGDLAWTGIVRPGEGDIIMMTPVGLLGIVLVLGMCWLVVRLVSMNSIGQAVDRREREELDALRTLVDDLKETAWEHRDLDSPLSTIIIDKIRSYERHRRELGP